MHNENKLKLMIGIVDFFSKVGRCSWWFSEFTAINHWTCFANKSAWHYNILQTLQHVSSHQNPCALTHPLNGKVFLLYVLCAFTDVVIVRWVPPSLVSHAQYITAQRGWPAKLCAIPNCKMPHQQIPGGYTKVAIMRNPVPQIKPWCIGLDPRLHRYLDYTFDSLHVYLYMLWCCLSRRHIL